ncbi:MAG TPA: AAA-like domain-containing protein [Blastocatellia bacterium]|nr:AAA-like domain-containing protein [Blastocatellia bacterium]
MTSTSLQRSFYVTGGTLHRDAPSYIQRVADDELYHNLVQGRFCYVLTSRQMGKSSLMVRTAVRLREGGTNVAVLDLTSIGQNLSADQWFDGLLARVGQQLDLEDELDDYWGDHERLGPMQRWMSAIEKVILRNLKGKTVIFVDEIDAVRSLPFSTDEFFAGIRELYNRRSIDPDLSRLTFCLLGVATPTDLIQDTRTTPFNIGQRIELSDFTESEAVILIDGLKKESHQEHGILNRVLYWTGGHPYLTQRLCKAVADDANVTGPEGVDRVCQDLFLCSRAREQDDNLLFVRERILRSEVDIASLLDLYSKVRCHRSVKDDETNPLASILKLSGVARVVDGCLKVRNKIYSTVFDTNWVKENMPDADLRRQRAAFRRGVYRATAVAVVIIVALVSGFAAFVAFKQRNLAKAEAEQMSNLVVQLNRTNEQKEAAYAEAVLQKKLAIDERQRAFDQQKIAEHKSEEAEEQRLIAIQQKALAERASEDAIRKSIEAEQAKTEALKQKEIAEQQKAEALKQKQIALDETELRIWEMIRDQKGPESLEAYLSLYPKGKFVTEAQSRILSLVRAQKMENFSRKESISENAEAATGAIVGRVYEGDSQAPVAGAIITATNQVSGLKRAARSGANGAYFIGSLPPGLYKIVITAEGFEPDIMDTFPVRTTKTNEIKPPFGTLRKAGTAAQKPSTKQ